MKKLFTQYINTFRGLSREVWWLSLITLINRAGTMVIPFLSLYLTKSMNFTLSDVGWIMSFFGLGSVVGTWLGGKLTDKIGYYKVMLVSLIGTGILFVCLQFAVTFYQFCIGIFSVMLVADAFRPAMFVALSAYSKSENKTRSVTLIRLAINLGFSLGPAVGGLIIISVGYQGLFWVDGVTCILAAVLLLNVLHPKKAKILDEVKVENPISVYKDKAFWVFFVAMFIFGFVFLQYFSTVPLYYKDVRLLSEFQIGLLMGSSGLFIFIFEMPLIQWLDKPKNSKVKLIALGLFLLAMSYLVLNISAWAGILLVGILLMSVGEMIAFPFSNSFAVDRAKKGNQGEYMALYSISFSLAHIFSHNSGMQMVAKYGFEFTWNCMILFALVGVFILLILLRVLKKEQINQSK
jgi:predicted MFS family arabinose efflux permease|tara:strand:+ start:5530 stop:6747 length:1218 start_codon:yes stop_codon:yes gene_type:complete